MQPLCLCVCVCLFMTGSQDFRSHLIAVHANETSQTCRWSGGQRGIPKAAENFFWVFLAIDKLCFCTRTSINIIIIYFCFNYSLLCMEMLTELWVTIVILY